MCTPETHQWTINAQSDEKMALTMAALALLEDIANAGAVVGGDQQGPVPL